MIVPDANLLLYAYDSDSPFNKVAKVWWSDCLSGNETIGLCEVVLYSFIRIGTNSKAFAKPFSIEEASSIALSWLAVPSTEVIAGEATDVERALALLQNAGTGGNLTTDAQIASLSLKYQAIVHTADTDFMRFPNVDWYNPILDQGSAKK
jgi:toxin-antitoxin system PIN domain toxin